MNTHKNIHLRSTLLLFYASIKTRDHIYEMTSGWCDFLFISAFPMLRFEAMREEKLTEKFKAGAEIQNADLQHQQRML